jgi:predicted regulator of Ras-like GTPase activity (Roadblock/LC7/MglB family)
MTKDGIRLRCGKSISVEQENLIDKVLSKLIEQTGIKLVMAIDTGGQVISFKGERSSIDLIGLGALVAADLAASQEIAKMADIYQENQVIIRQGSKVNTIIHEMGREMILMVMVASTVPLGWFNYIVRQASRQIEEILQKNLKNEDEIVILSPSNSLVDDFSAALDSVWKS